MLDRMTQALGGRAAEELVIGEIHTGAHQDIEMVSKIARAMVTEYGMSDDLGPIAYGHRSQHGVPRQGHQRRSATTPRRVAEKIDAGGTRDRGWLLRSRP
jgi:cell division protease FtsH